MSAPRLPLSSRPTFLPDEISRREFATVFRGYDPAEVRTFLNQLAEQAADTGDRVAEIQRTLAETEERVKNPELDEDTVTKLLGEQTAQILRSAREAANDIRQKAEEEVSRNLREAHEVTTRMREEAEALLAERTEEAEAAAKKIRDESTEAAESLRAEAEAESQSVRTEAANAAERLRSETEAEMVALRQQTQSDLVDERSAARAQARDIIEAARGESQALIERTQAKQTELLEGLVRKRKIALAQVEELRAGRQRLLQAYKLVRGTLDEVTDELERVEEQARQAATEAGAAAAKNSNIDEEELDTMIELEQITLSDDVPADVVDLVESDDDARRLFGVSDVSGGSSATPSNGSDGGTATLERTEAETEDSASAVERAAFKGMIMGEARTHAASDFDEAVVAKRESALNKTKSQTARRLKRSLQDEQDALIARLRSGTTESVQAVIGSAEDQASTHQKAIVKQFREVARSGAEAVPGARFESSDLEHFGNTAAREMANELVEDLRSELVPVIESVIAENLSDNNEIQSRVAEPYRAVKGDYLDRLIEDRLEGAFDQGVALAGQS